MDLRLFPLQTVLFPGMRLPIHVFEDRYRLMIRECIEEDAPFGVLLIKSGSEVGGPAVPHDLGTTARILQVEYLEDGRMNIFTIGERRFRTIALNTTQPYLRGETWSGAPCPAWPGKTPQRPWVGLSRLVSTGCRCAAARRALSVLRLAHLRILPLTACAWRPGQRSKSRPLSWAAFSTPCCRRSMASWPVRASIWVPPVTHRSRSFLTGSLAR